MENKKVLNFISNALIGLVVLLALLLAVSKLPIPGNYKVLTVLSGSMEPTIHTGAVVVIKPAGNYAIGDIVTFGETGKNKIPVTHRVKEIQVIEGKEAYITKGDANNDADSRQIAKDEIIGKVAFNIPFLGYILEFVKTPLGFSLVVILPAIVIIGDELFKIYKEFKKKSGSKAEKEA